jgi:copper homeostasis protein
MIVEICVDSLESAIIAEKSGANRIELCSALALGGITPSWGLIETSVQKLSIGIHVLIRPRGGDFTYSESEIDLMVADIEMAKNLGVQGIVSGVLYENHTLDIENTTRLIKACEGLPFTFHRAFDWIPNKEEALDQLDDLGIQRILTSGGSTKAIDALETLTTWNRNYNTAILPGGGINSSNYKAFKTAGFEEIHLSATKIIDKGEVEIPMNALKYLIENGHILCDSKEVSTICEGG